MKTPHELFFAIPSRNDKLHVFGYGAYVYVHKLNRKTEFSRQALLCSYDGLRNGLHHVYVPGRTELLTTKHVSFDEPSFSLATSDQKTLNAVLNLWNQQKADEVDCNVIKKTFPQKKDQLARNSFKDRTKPTRGVATSVQNGYVGAPEQKNAEEICKIPTESAISSPPENKATEERR